MTAAFNASLLSERSHLAQFAMYLAKKRDRAEDLVQETLCRALEKEHQFSAGTNLRAWLITILRNQHFTQCRKSGRIIADSDGIMTMYLLAKEDQAASFEAKDALSHLDDLSEEHRSVLLMLVEGVSIEDMAAKYGVPTGTIKSRINRARVALHRVVDA